MSTAKSEWQDREVSLQASLDAAWLNALKKQRAARLGPMKSKQSHGDNIVEHARYWLELTASTAITRMACTASILRDLRAWHAGTPNTTEETRFLSNVEVISDEYAAYIDGPHTFSDRTPCDVMCRCRMSACVSLQVFVVLV